MPDFVVRHGNVMTRWPWKYGTRSKAVIHDTPSLSGEYLYHEWRIPLVEGKLWSGCDVIYSRKEGRTDKRTDKVKPVYLRPNSLTGEAVASVSMIPKNWEIHGRRKLSKWPTPGCWQHKWFVFIHTEKSLYLQLCVQYQWRSQKWPKVCRRRFQMILFKETIDVHSYLT